MEAYMTRYKQWSENEFISDEIRDELLSLADNTKEIEERFYKDLEFGTGGLRGIIGAGTNRMNIYTVGRATRGLCDYLNDTSMGSYDEKSIVISYDSRNMSWEFALHTALTAAANGVKAYLFSSTHPVPMLSFAVIHLKASLGVMITASHNTKEYNGYKVYGADGAQISVDFSDKVLRYINRIEDYSEINALSREEAESKGLLVILGDEIDNAFMESIKKQCINPDISKLFGKEARIVYTPIHGTGNVPVRRILSECGFENVFVVKEQELPDPEFSTVKSPNPEEKGAFEYAIKLANEVDADIIIATDPDCDRLGLAVKNDGGSGFKLLTGNQIGCLMMEYILSQKFIKKNLPANPFTVKTFVTTELARKIAEYYGVQILEVLTGFKFIGEKIKILDDEGDMNFVFGFEESYGFLAGKHARDKDGVVAAMLIAEMLAWYKSEETSFQKELQKLYEKYGFFMEDAVNVTLDGIEGKAKIASAMQSLRNDVVLSFGKFGIKRMRDYLGQKYIVFKDGKAHDDGVIEGLPKSDAIYFETDDGSWVCVRPSGTEPKIKIYMGISSDSEENARLKINELKNSVMEVMNPRLSQDF